MKKLMVLMIAMSYCLISAGSALANKPVINSLDNHAVWSKWFDESGNRLTGTLGVTDSTPGSEHKISTRTSDKREMKGEIAEFGFVRETKKYDYAKDKGHST